VLLAQPQRGILIKRTINTAIGNANALLLIVASLGRARTSKISLQMGDATDED
jgi:hypothetical protein